MPTHYEGTPEEIMALDTLIKLTRATQALETRMGERGTIGSLTVSQFGVLETLYHLGPMCQGELSRKQLKSTGNMTLVIDNLEKHGLVQRVRSEQDRRMVLIELLPAGRELIAEIFPRHAAAVAEEMSVLTREEQRELGRLLRKLGRGRLDQSCESAQSAQESSAEDALAPAG